MHRGRWRAVATAVGALAGCGATGGSTASSSTIPEPPDQIVGSATLRILQKHVPFQLQVNVCNPGNGTIWACQYTTSDASHVEDYDIQLNRTSFSAVANPIGADDRTFGPGAWPYRFSGSYPEGYTYNANS